MGVLVSKSILESKLQTVELDNEASGGRPVTLLSSNVTEEMYAALRAEARGVGQELGEGHAGPSNTENQGPITSTTFWELKSRVSPPFYETALTGLIKGRKRPDTVMVVFGAKITCGTMKDGKIS